MSIDIDYPNSDQPIDQPIKERTNLPMPEGTLKLTMPDTAALVRASLQKLRLDRSMSKLKPNALKELVTLVGNGAIQTQLMGRPVELKLGRNKSIRALPGNETVVSQAYEGPQRIMEEADKRGETCVKEVSDFNVVFISEAKPEPRTIVIPCAEDKSEIMSAEELRLAAPTLRSLAFCQMQKNHLDKKVKVLTKKARTELEAYPETNILTETNHQDVRISTFEKEVKSIKPEFPDTIKSLKAAQQAIPKALEKLVADGLATPVDIFYLEIKRRVQPI